GWGQLRGRLSLGGAHGASDPHRDRARGGRRSKHALRGRGPCLPVGEGSLGGHGSPGAGKKKELTSPAQAEAAPPGSRFQTIFKQPQYKSQQPAMFLPPEAFGSAASVDDQ